MLCIKHTRKLFSHKDSQLEDQNVGKINRVYPTGRYDPLRFTQITLFEIFFSLNYHETDKTWRAETVTETSVSITL